MTRIGTHDATNALSDDHATVLAPRADGGSYFHGRLRRKRGSGYRWISRWYEWCRRYWLRGISCGIIGAEAVDDASFLEVIRSHFESYSVTREDPHLVHSHATSEVAEELVILGFQRCDADSERRIWITFFYDADEFNDILRQGLYGGEKYHTKMHGEPRDPTDPKKPEQDPWR